MNRAGSPTIWQDRTPLLVLGTGAALPGEPIATEELLTVVDRRFGLSLRRPGLAIARKLGIRTRHLCRDMARRLEAPRNGHRNPELAAGAVRGALSDAGPADAAEHRSGRGAIGLRRPLRRISPSLHRLCQCSGVRAGIAARGSRASRDRRVRNRLGVF